MSRSVPLPMTREMFGKFDDSTIRCVWKVMRNLVVPEISDSLSPIPYIDAANYFDLLNIFAESSENVLDSAMKMIGRARKYQYVAKLKDVANFTTSDSGKIRQIVSVGESRMYKFRPVFESIVEGSQGNVSKMYFFRAENIKLYVVRFELDRNTGIAIDRMYPGLERSKRVLMISEVCCADRIFIRTRNGGPDDVHEWSYQGPIPIAFGATKLKLDKYGIVLSKKLVAKRKLADTKRWMAPRVSHPPFCPVLQVVTRDGPGSAADAKICQK